MANDVVDITDEVKEKLRDFDEQEAYFLLCEIFSYAQATKDYAKFQIDLNEWKKRYPIDLFSVGHIVDCYVDDIDIDKKKVSLTLLKE